VSVLQDAGMPLLFYFLLEDEQIHRVNGVDLPLKLLIMKGLMLVWLQLLAYTEPRVQKPAHNID